MTRTIAINQINANIVRLKAEMEGVLKYESDKYAELMVHILKVERARLREICYDKLEERSCFAEKIRSRAEDGKVAMVVSGMDCDCSQFTRSYLYPANAFQLEKLMDICYMDAEGPTSVYFVPPSERPESYSRDLAMEAYEDGHPHIVYC